MAILQLESIMYNVMANARSCSAYPLPEECSYRQFFFSRDACYCGCSYHTSAPLVAEPPPRAAGPVDSDDDVGSSESEQD